MADKPHFIFRDGMTADRDYVQWIADIKSRYRNSQIKAAIKVNSALLEFYWSVGRDLAVLKAEERWGSGIVKQFDLDMRNAFPEAKGFSYSNVKDMKRWYLFYYKQLIKGQQVVDPNDVTGKGHQPSGLIAATEKSHQVGGLLEMPKIFGQVPWKHHVYIVSKSKSLDEALFYKGNGDNQSVGLIICKTAKRTIVEWSLKDINKPLGVASYQLEEVVARTIAEIEQRKENNPNYQQQEAINK